MNVIIGERPPTHEAPCGTLFQDRDGLHWEQVGRTVLIGLVGTYRMMGGRDWRVFSPHGARGGVMLRSEGITEVSALATTCAPGAIADNTNTKDFHTWFPVRRTFRLCGMVLPLHGYTSGTIDVKIGLYQRASTLAFCGYKLADSRLLFSRSGYTPTVIDPCLIPFNTATQDGLIIRKGADLWVRAVWGTQLVSTIAVVSCLDYNGTGTSNHTRRDRERTTGIDYTSPIATLMSETFSSTPGSAAGAATLGLTNWGMFGDYLD